MTWHVQICTVDSVVSIGLVRIADVSPELWPPARRSLGQNFLTSEAVLHRIADSAQLDDTDCIVEVGPGT